MVDYVKPPQSISRTNMLSIMRDFELDFWEMGCTVDYEWCSSFDVETMTDHHNWIDNPEPDNEKFWIINMRNKHMVRKSGIPPKNALTIDEFKHARKTRMTSIKFGL